MISVKLNNYTPPNNLVKTFDLNFGVFFDGTKNNKTNSDQRVAHEKGKGGAAYVKYGTEEDSSYQNDWSNVARLWSTYDRSRCIYIEGIGTEDKGEDSSMGYAFGTGTTGIRGKVRKGCVELVKLIKPFMKSGNTSKLGYLTLDVFGFSRGAAAARNFVYEIGKGAYKHKTVFIPESPPLFTDDDGYSTTLDVLPAGGHFGLMLSEAGIKIELRQIKVRFLGIFDTVSSYSKNFSVSPDFNDVKELSLNEIGRAETVIHFVAENEHRKNFSLTHTQVGKEKIFPGVHSDVGGSYRTETETVKELETSWTLKSNLDNFKQKLIREGWYKESQLKVTGGNMYWALQGDRFLKKEYSYIPLHFMAKYGKDKSLPIDLSGMENDKYSIKDDGFLGEIKERLRGYVMGNGQQYTLKSLASIEGKYIGAKIPDQRYADYLKEKKERDNLLRLRNEYLHWSATKVNSYGVIQPMAPNSDGKRVYY